MGVRVERHRKCCSTRSPGRMAGIAGLLFMAARINSGDPTAGLNYELTAITATILGGTNLFGGRGSVLGTLIGALIMGVLQNGLNLMAVRPFYQQMAIGTVLILAVWLDRINAAGLAAMSLLELEDVRSLRHGRSAARGHLLRSRRARGGLVGDNGAGKSTLMKTITGVHRRRCRRRSASTALDHRQAIRASIRAAGIEMIYQDLALARMQDVASNIFLGREPTRCVLGLPSASIDRPASSARPRP